MKTETELRELLNLVIRSMNGMDQSDAGLLVKLATLLDIIRWTLGEPNVIETLIVHLKAND